MYNISTIAILEYVFYQKWIRLQIVEIFSMKYEIPAIINIDAIIEVVLNLPSTLLNYAKFNSIKLNNLCNK